MILCKHSSFSDCRCIVAGWLTECVKTSQFKCHQDWSPDLLWHVGWILSKTDKEAPRGGNLILRLGNLTTPKTNIGMLNIRYLTSHTHHISSVIYFWDARKVQTKWILCFFKNILLTVLFVNNVACLYKVILQYYWSSTYLRWRMIEHSYHEYIFYLYEALKKCKFKRIWIKLFENSCLNVRNYSWM